MAKHSKGAKVTIPRLELHATILDNHVSHRVRRGDTEIIVGEDEQVEGVEGEPLETYTSYLIERQWDGAPLWVSEDDIVAGHDFTLRSDR